MSITTEQVRALRDEAGQAGDLAMARICDLALGTSASDMEALMFRPLHEAEREAVEGMTQDGALAECERVIADAMRNPGE